MSRMSGKKDALYDVLVYPKRVESLAREHIQDLFEQARQDPFPIVYLEGRRLIRETQGGKKKPIGHLPKAPRKHPRWKPGVDLTVHG